MAELTTRFTRINSRGEGAGLGLAIVEVIVRNTKGQLNLYSPRPYHVDGFMAEICFYQS
ncbi:hypothetical protein LPB41_29985 [Thalassospira sp. MA62]|nr:hypothetical protein [Thalassospira sp. MA62]